MENPFLCPKCGKLAVKNLNVFPQQMWACDRQNWSCEHCLAPIYRLFQNSRWTRWMMDH